MDYKAAKTFQQIAEDKGYSDSKKFFWWAFLYPPAGIAMVIALPDLKQRALNDEILLALKAQKNGKSNSKSSSGYTNNSLPEL